MVQCQILMIVKQISELTIEFAPLVTNNVERVRISSDNVLPGVTCSPAKQNDLRLGY